MEDIRGTTRVIVTILWKNEISVDVSRTCLWTALFGCLDDVNPSNLDLRYQVERDMEIT